MPAQANLPAGVTQTHPDGKGIHSMDSIRAGGRKCPHTERCLSPHRQPQQALYVWDDRSQMHHSMCINQVAGGADKLTHPDELQLQELGQLGAQLHNPEEGGDDVVRAVPNVADLLQGTHTNSCQTLDAVDPECSH